jgi:hypothetical protein
MNNSRPWNALAHAVFTYVPIAEKRGRRTERPVIVQGLDYRDIFVIGRVVRSRRNHRESVVDVHDVWPFLIHQGPEFPVDLLVPDSFAEHDQGMCVSHLIVAGLVQEYPVAVGPQQVSFLGKNLIFASGFLVRVVHCQNFHLLPSGVVVEQAAREDPPAGDTTL